MTIAPPRTPRATFSRGLFVGAAFITTMGVGLATFALVRAFNPAPRPGMGLTPLAERKALAFSMPTLDHGTWTLADHAGHVVLLNYFATWCPPCLEEMPEIKGLQRDYGGRGLDVAAISVNADSDDNRPRALTVAEFDAREKLPFPILLPAAESPLLDRTNDFPIPQTLLIDRRGRVAMHITGGLTAREIKPFLEQLLKE